MALTVKICGLTDPAALDAALAAGADMVGFVFFPPSPRHLGLAEAQALGARAAGRAKKVALTVDATDAELADAVAALAPDLLQFHGRETPERLAAVKARFGLPVIKAFPVETEADLAAIRPYAGIADMLLLDARAPKEATRPGGLGRSFDWTLLTGFRPPQPWLLSGGLTPQNVATALAVTGAPGVDVSSGVEAAPGRKDPALIESFIRHARGAVPLRGADAITKDLAS